jgi:hypothetical protein
MCHLLLIPGHNPGWTLDECFLKRLTNRAHSQAQKWVCEPWPAGGPLIVAWTVAQYGMRDSTAVSG